MKNCLALIFTLALSGINGVAQAQYGGGTPPPPAPTRPYTIARAISSGHEILADRNGLTAYIFDRDTGSVSNCYDGCARAWPPILVLETDALEAPFGITERRDGAKQLTHEGKPLYLYAGDTLTGETEGDGLGGVWHIVPADDGDGDR